MAFFQFLERVNVVKLDLVHFANQKRIHGFNLQTSGAVQVVADNVYFEIMLVFAPVNVKRLLVGLVSDAVPHLASEHHLTAIHEIEHHVFQVSLKCFRIDQVEVDLLISDDLDALVALDEVKVASFLKFLIHYPSLFLAEGVCLQFKEQDLAAASSN